MDYLSYEYLINEHFAIILQWNLNVNKYKVISQIIIEVLTIQIFTITSQYLFPTSDRILDSFRVNLYNDGCANYEV